MNITRAAAPSTQAVSPALILTRCAAAAASHTVSTRHLRFSHPSDGGRLDERFNGATGTPRESTTRRRWVQSVRRGDGRPEPSWSNSTTGADHGRLGHPPREVKRRQLGVTEITERARDEPVDVI